MADPIPVDYTNAEYVQAVEQGLRITGKFDAVSHHVDDEGSLVFVDAQGNMLAFLAPGR